MMCRMTHNRCNSVMMVVRHCYTNIMYTARHCYKNGQFSFPPTMETYQLPLPEKPWQQYKFSFERAHKTQMTNDVFVIFEFFKSLI